MSVTPKGPALEPAAGFSLESRASRPDRVPLKKGEYSVASRALALSTYFLSGALAINLSQFLGSPLYLVNKDWYNAWIAFTKQSFGLLTMTLTQTFAPTKVIVSGDSSVRGQLLKSSDGNLILDFPERIVLVANHQIYTDWLYLWWIAYCNGMHGRLYIILKESLKKIPILGWGMQLSQFIFLKRNWEQDKPNMASALQRLNNLTDPMWLLLFPEGTNLAPSTRAKSAAWAKKTNVSDTKHVLLPRSTGLQFCLEELKGSVDYLYDCTVAYEGVPRGQYAQDIFTLKAGYLEGRPPKSVSMHWRRFAIKDIPLHNDKAFELWLTARWREKDLLMEQYLQRGSFPADIGMTKYKSGRVLRGCGHLQVPIQASRWYEFLQIFAPMGILAMVLYIFYGDLPQKFWKSINKEALQSRTDDIKKAGTAAGKEAKSISSSLSGLTLDSFFEPSQQEETFKTGAIAVSKLLTSSSAQNLLSRADFLQQFLSDPQKMVTDSITNKQQSFMEDLAQEEARRQQSRGPGPARPLKSVANAAGKRKGTFWDEIEAEESSRYGSVVSAPSRSGQSHKGRFWEDLQAAEEKRLNDTTTGAGSRGNFWDAVKAEENSRYGTVVTLSSNASTAVASESSTMSKRSIPKLGPRKATNSANDRVNKANTGPPSSTKTKKPTNASKNPGASVSANTANATKQPAKIKSTAANPTKISTAGTNLGPLPASTLSATNRLKDSTSKPSTVGPRKPPESLNNGIKAKPAKLATSAGVADKTKSSTTLLAHNATKKPATAASTAKSAKSKAPNPALKPKSNPVSKTKPNPGKPPKLKPRQGS